MNEQLMAIIPHIPAILQSGKSVWELMIKPILKQIGYNISKELEQEMTDKEKNNDIVGMINSIENLAKSIKPNIANQSYIGDKGNQFINLNNGDVKIIQSNERIEQTSVKLSDLAELILKELSSNQFNELTVRQIIGGLFSVKPSHKELGSMDNEHTILIKGAIKELLDNNFISIKRHFKEDLTGCYEMTVNGLNYLKNNL